MSDGIGLAEALLGLDGFRILEVIEVPDEVVITIESTLDFVGCTRCGVRAEAHDRMRIEIRDLACFGRPARLVWVKRRWRCVEPACDAKTWTERSEHVDAQVVLTTYDWSAVPASIREDIGFPPFGPDHLDNSLRHLSDLVTAPA